MTKKLFIKTYGCQMNTYDSARMADVLAPLGYQLTETVDAADMVILNTCHIRERAAEKVFSELGRLNQLRKERSKDQPPLILAVAGCVAQAEGEEILRRAPYVDIVLGPQTYHRLPEMVAKATRAAGAVLDTEFPVESKFDHLPQVRAGGSSAFLSVQEGCDKFCTFCVVPYTRGAEYSRPVAAILDEAKALVAQGVIEITLLGQSINSWTHTGPDGRDWRLADLLRAMASVDGLEQLRYTTSHPVDLDDDLIAAHRDLPTLMPFLHLPVQSGSDRILKAMNRNHTHAEYLEKVTRLKAARPDLALSSDFIVGFPGETEEDFLQTLDLVRQAGIVGAYSFKYSPRPGTPAAAMDNQVPEDVKDERLARLQALLTDQTSRFNHACLGREMTVVLDRVGRHAGQGLGRSPYMQPVHVDHVGDRLGQKVRVRIDSVHPNSLGAVLL